VAVWANPPRLVYELEDGATSWDHILVSKRCQPVINAVEPVKDLDELGSHCAASICEKEECIAGSQVFQIKVLPEFQLARRAGSGLLGELRW
jgi:hypothetical protein